MNHPGRLRVLVLTNLYPSPGQPARGTFIRSQVESLAAFGCEVQVLEIEGFRQRRAYLRAIPRLRRLLREGDFDLIHAHYGFSGWVALTQSRLPVVISFLGDDLLGEPKPDGRLTWSSRVWAGINRALAPRYAAIIVKSEGMRRALGRTAAHVIPNGVDLELFRPMERDECLRRLGLSPGPVRVLFAASPAVARKRHGLAVAAVDLLQRERPGAVLHTVSNTPQDGLALWMNACNALILPSWSEGSPNVVKEAMACNLPVVATDVGDVRALLEHFPGNVVVDDQPDARSTAERLAEALARVISAGRSRGREAMAGLSLPAVARRIRSVYDEVVARATRN